MYPYELVGYQSVKTSLRFPKRARPLRWPVSGRNLPLDSRFIAVPQVQISDFCVPMLSLVAKSALDFGR